MYMTIYLFKNIEILINESGNKLKKRINIYIIYIYYCSCSNRIRYNSTNSVFASEVWTRLTLQLR